MIEIRLKSFVNSHVRLEVTMAFIFLIFFQGHAGAFISTFEYNQKNLKFSFNYSVPKKWKARTEGVGLVYFIPTQGHGDESIDTEPVSLAVVPSSNLKSGDMEVRGEIQKNPHQVIYVPIYMKSFGRRGFLFGEGKDQVIILPPVRDKEFSDHFSDISPEIIKSFRFKDQAENRAKLILDRGGFFSRIKYYFEIKEMSRLIYNRNISYKQLIEYLVKGGNPDILENYASWFVGAPPVPVLNFFISRDLFKDGPTQEGWVKDNRNDLLKSLQLLLDNGANPNVAPQVTTVEHATPLLFATWVNDKKSMQLLMNYGADTNAVQKLYLGQYGPALLLANDDAAADIIFEKKPNLLFKDEDGNNLVQILLFSSPFSTSPDHIKNRLQWMIKNNLTFEWPEGGDFDPLKRARWMVENIDANLDNIAAAQSRTGWKEICVLLEQIKKK